MNTSIYIPAFLCDWPFYLGAVLSGICVAGFFMSYISKFRIF